MCKYLSYVRKIPLIPRLGRNMRESNRFPVDFLSPNTQKFGTVPLYAVKA